MPLCFLHNHVCNTVVTVIERTCGESKCALAARQRNRPQIRKRFQRRRDSDAKNSASVPERHEIRSVSGCRIQDLNCSVFLRHTRKSRREERRPSHKQDSLQVTFIHCREWLRESPPILPLRVWSTCFQVLHFDRTQGETPACGQHPRLSSTLICSRLRSKISP